jgi:uncharacterized protein YcaQ
MIQTFIAEQILLPVQVADLPEAAYLDRNLLPDWEKLHAGHGTYRTTLLSPFDNLLWDRAKVRTIFSYDVHFEAYVQPEKRQYGYYCLAILHHGNLVGRVDPKVLAGCLVIRALYLEPGVSPNTDLLNGIAHALQELATFVHATSISLEQTVPQNILQPLAALI